MSETGGVGERRVRERVKATRTRNRVRQLPAGDFIVHAVVFLIGLALIGTGLALAVLPGPLTIPPILLGLAVWSLEFDFAERWLRPFETRAQRAWDAAKARPWRTGAVTGAGLLAAAAAVYLFLRLDLLDAIT